MKIPKATILAVNIFLLAGILAFDTHAGPGDVDPSFDPGTGANNNVNHIALQTDGKVLIGGGFTTVQGVSRNRIARLNTDGALDTSFNPARAQTRRLFPLPCRPTPR
jgi:hypothetical protein